MSFTVVPLSVQGHSHTQTYKVLCLIPCFIHRCNKTEYFIHQDMKFSWGKGLCMECCTKKGRNSIAWLLAKVWKMRGVWKRRDKGRHQLW